MLSLVPTVAESLISKLAFGVAYSKADDAETSILVIYASPRGYSFIRLTPDEDDLLQKCLSIHDVSVVEHDDGSH